MSRFWFVRKTISVHTEKTVDSFIEFHKGKEVLVFTDGSVEEGFIGIGGCAAVLLPISPEENEKIANDKLYILSDCLSATEIVINRHQLIFHSRS